MSISWVCCQSKMGVPFNRFRCLQSSKRGQCFLLGVLFSHLKMQKTIQKDTRWRKREGERRDTMDCLFNGKSKEKNRREMNGEEGETKQGAEKMCTLLCLSSLPCFSLPSFFSK